MLKRSGRWEEVEWEEAFNAVVSGLKGREFGILASPHSTLEELHLVSQLGPEERLTARRALDLYLTPLADPAGRPRRVAPAAPADLCLLDAPLDEVLADPSCEHVRWVLRRGTVLSR